jgi:hypothetical protein
MMRCALALAIAACGAAPPTPAPAYANDVDVGSLAIAAAKLRIDVLVPAGGDLPAALERARATARGEGLRVVDALPAESTEPTATVAFASLGDQEWRSHIRDGGYVSTKLSRTELDQMQLAVGIVEIQALGPKARGWEVVRASMHTANDLAQAIHGWVYKSSRLFDVAAFAATVAALDRRDARDFVRIMRVASKRGPSHARTIGLSSFGMPELYVPDVPDDLLDRIEAVLLATAQQLIDRGGVTRRGVIDTGKLTWHARWIHDPVNPALIEIELTTPNLDAALRAP